jgi:signal recognition particle subunit SRP54
LWAIGDAIPALRQFVQLDDDANLRSEVRRIGAMIESMTSEERRDPRRVDDCRRQRIAKGSGTSPSEVRKLLADFEVMRQMMLRSP